MGIRLESIHGGKLSGGESLYREGKIIWHGLGMFIPVVNLFIVAFVVSMLAGLDAVMPTYRAEGITIAEFAENHRDYEKTVDAESEFILSDDGKWKERVPSDTMYVVFDDPDDRIRPEFQYEFDEFRNIRAVSYENSWENIDIQRVLPFYCEAAIYSVIGSRPGSKVWDYGETADLLESELYRKLSVQIEESEGSFTVNDVTVSWITQIENCDFVQDGIVCRR